MISYLASHFSKRLELSIRAHGPKVAYAVEHLTRLLAERSRVPPTAHVLGYQTLLRYFSISFIATELSQSPVSPLLRLYKMFLATEYLTVSIDSLVLDWPPRVGSESELTVLLGDVDAFFSFAIIDYVPKRPALAHRVIGDLIASPEDIAASTGDLSVLLLEDGTLSRVIESAQSDEHENGNLSP